MKHSPLCSRDGGKEITFTAKEGDTKYRFVIPRALLDDECGDTASEADRKQWVNAHLPNILAARPDAEIATKPFHRIHIEEIV